MTTWLPARLAVWAILAPAGLVACDKADPSLPTGPVDTTIPEPRPATITGKLSYPSDYIPEDMRVCAERTESPDRNCSAAFKVSNGRRLYTLTVPAGSYRIYAETRAWPGYKAYYTEAVTCGLGINCSSHEPITVKVASGEKRAEINPQDWYKPGA
jgi:hypothetical protein